jgi:hypothetical protein
MAVKRNSSLSAVFHCQSAALSGTQRHSAALSGTQQHSVALSGTQCTPRARHSTMSAAPPQCLPLASAVAARCAHRGRSRAHLRRQPTSLCVSIRQRTPTSRVEHQLRSASCPLPGAGRGGRNGCDSPLAKFAVEGGSGGLAAGSPSGRALVGVRSVST